MLPLLLALSVTLPVDTGSVDMTRRVEVFEDTSATMSFEQVVRKAEFHAHAGDRLEFGYTSSAYWFRVSVRAPDAVSRWFVEVGPPILDHVDVYFRRGDREPLHFVTGDHHAFSTRPIAHPRFVFALPGRDTRPTQIYVRVRTAGTMSVELRLWRDREFIANVGRSELAWGCYFAFLLALALYNLFLYTVVRDRSYLFYVGYMACFVLLQASLSGHAFRYLWPQLPGFASVSAGTFLCVSMGFAVLFIRDMANVGDKIPALHKPMAVVAVLFFALLPALWLSYTSMVRAATAFTALIILALPVPIVLSYTRGYRPARYLVLGMIAIFPAGLLTVLHHLGVLPNTFVTEHAVQLGTALEALLLSFALADRINLLTHAEAEAQTRRLAAERVALAAQRDLSRKLIDAQDNERRRIASELHDGLGQNMLAIVNQLKRDAPDSELTALASQTVADVRRVAHGLHPHKLDRLGLTTAIDETVHSLLHAASIEPVCHLDDVDGVLPPGAELHVYRIVQEAVANSVKHASASEVSVVLRRAGDMLELRIEDDGKGTDMTAGAGLGLASIEERARLLGAELHIDSTPGHGFALHLNIGVTRP